MAQDAILVDGETYYSEAYVFKMVNLAGETAANVTIQKLQEQGLLPKVDKTEVNNGAKR